MNIYGGIFLPLQGLLVGDKRGSEILTWYQSRPSVWITVERTPHLSSSGRTGKRKKKKKTSLCVRGSVGSPTSAKHGPIEVNIYGGIFFPLQGLLVGDKRGSEILTLLV